jgi:hypothetical protein
MLLSTVNKLPLLLATSTDCALADDTLPSKLPASLSHAGLEHPDSLTEALYTIELRLLQDIRMLDDGERAEMSVCNAAGDECRAGVAREAAAACGCTKRDGRAIDRRMVERSFL